MLVSDNMKILHDGRGTVVLSLVCYLASDLPGEGVHNLLNAVVCEDGGVVEKLLVRQLVSVDDKGVGHQRVPVVEVAELQSDAVPVLEVGIEEQGGIELQLQHVAAEVLHVLLDHYFYGLT